MAVITWQGGLYEAVCMDCLAFFQMLMSTHVLNGTDTVGCECFIDDVVLYAADSETFLGRLREILSRFARWSLRV